MIIRGIAPLTLIALLSGCALTDQIQGRPAANQQSAPAPSQTATVAVPTGQPSASGSAATVPSTTPANASPPATAPTLDVRPDSPSASPEGGLSSVKPSDPFQDATLETGGYGPVKVGMSRTEAVKAGYLVTSAVCGYEPSQALLQRGISINTGPEHVVEVMLYSPDGGRSKATTRSGAAAGMTVGQVKAIYGNQLKIEGKIGDNGESFQAGVIRSGGRELVVVPDYGSNWQAPMRDSMTVRSIIARDYSGEVHGGC